MTVRMTLGAAVAVPLLLAGFDAQAHAHLVKSSPAENATAPAPEAIDLEFSEKLEAKLSGADLVRADGAAVAATAKATAKSITIRPAAALAPGGYVVKWHAVAADGHPAKGQYSFTVK